MEVDGSGGRGAGEEAAEERSDPLAAGEGAAESERVGANEADENSAGVDVGERLTGAAGT